jgi:hypothetical protein
MEQAGYPERLIHEVVDAFVTGHRRTSIERLLSYHDEQMLARRSPYIFSPPSSRTRATAVARAFSTLIGLRSVALAAMHDSKGVTDVSGRWVPYLDNKGVSATRCLLALLVSVDGGPESLD